jgi:hypothetical protein
LKSIIYFEKEGLEDYVELEEDGIVVVASPTFPKSYNLPALGLSSLKHTIKAVFGILRNSTYLFCCLWL